MTDRDLTILSIILTLSDRPITHVVSVVLVFILAEWWHRR